MPAIKTSSKQSVSFLLACMFALNGCSSWRVLDRPLDATSSRHVRTTLENGDRMEVRGAHIRADTLLGVEAWSQPAKQVAVPLSEVHRVEQRRIAVGRTIAAVGGAAAAVSLVGLVYFGNRTNWGF